MHKVLLSQFCWEVCGLDSDLSLDYPDCDFYSDRTLFDSNHYGIFDIRVRYEVIKKKLT